MFIRITWLEKLQSKQHSKPILYFSILPIKCDEMSKKIKKRNLRYCEWTLIESLVRSYRASLPRHIWSLFLLVSSFSVYFPFYSRAANPSFAPSFSGTKGHVCIAMWRVREKFKPLLNNYPLGKGG